MLFPRVLYGVQSRRNNCVLCDYISWKFSENSKRDIWFIHERCTSLINFNFTIVHELIASIIVQLITTVHVCAIADNKRFAV